MSLNGRKVLLVDDEPPIIVAIKEYLSSLGCEVDSAQELEEALALIAKKLYHLVIADLRLTGFGGAEGLEVLSHARERSPETRLIILSAYGSPEIEMEARRRGVDHFLHKPTPLGEIARLAEELVGSRPAG